MRPTPISTAARVPLIAVCVVAVVLHTAVLAGLGVTGWAVTGLVTSGTASGGVARGGADERGGASGDGAPGEGAGGEFVPARFDQTVTYDDGLELSLTAPRPFEPSPEARGGGQPDAVVITLTLHNGGPAEVPLRAASSVVSGGVAADVVVDAANGLTGVPPVGSIAPGQTVSYEEGYSVADAADVAVVFEPSPAYLPARFAR